MNIRSCGAGLSAILWLAGTSSCAAKELLPSLAPDLAYHSLVDQLCIQGYSMRIYRINGRIDIERGKNKVASVVPVGSLAEIERDYLLAQWGSATESRLIGLWSVAPDQVEGVYSVLALEKTRQSLLKELDCFASDPPPNSMIAWLQPRMGLVTLFSIVDESLNKPTYIAMYSSWLGPNALTGVVKAALHADGWIVSLGNTGIAPAIVTRTIRATREQAKLDLSIFSAQGTSVMYMVAQ